jgi:hypothetical protein
VSSLPSKKKRNRVTEAVQGKPINPLANVPVGTNEIEEHLSAAKEVHQHKTIRHVVMIVHDDESQDVLCLFCGGKTRLKKPYAPEFDMEGFNFFKQFHLECPVPKAPVGFFNVDMAAEDKRNPVFENKGSGVTVELQKIVANRDDGSEVYHFVDLANPEQGLTMPKEQFLSFFTRKEV